MQNRVRIRAERLLSDNWTTLKTTTFDYLRRDGRWQTLERETYDRGNGAVVLLCDPERRTVLLTRQFRFPAYVSGHSGFLIEAPAGLLDGESPETRIRAEIEEETGYRAGALHKLMEIFMSPGSVTEKLHFFIGEYDSSQPVSKGGGLAEEGEDIETLHLPLDEALAMADTGEVIDGKTILLLQAAARRWPVPKPMQILVAGPYRSGTDDDPARIAANLAAMEACALPLYALGHIPVLGEWLALPLVQAAGSTQIGDSVYDELFHPHCERLLHCCDAVLRIGGPSAGADRMVARARELGLAIYTQLSEVPAITAASC